MTLAPASTAITPAAICPISLPSGGRSRASSIAPTSAISTAPAISPHVSTVPPEPRVPTVRGSLIVAGIQIAAATSTPTRIASPPSSGVLRVASPRSLGIASAPTRRANRAATGVSAAATAIATTKASTASRYMASP